MNLIELADRISDLLATCRHRQGILTTKDIPQPLHSMLSPDERLRVLGWMRNRQRRKNNGTNNKRI